MTDKLRKTKEEVVSDLRAVFHIGEEGCLSRENKGSFFIDKREYEYEREDVISMLRKYFENLVIADGQCRIDPITLMYTMFHIEDRQEEVRDA